MHKLSDPNSWLSQYGDILYRHALFRLRDPMIAEETVQVQETFVAALQARQRFAGNAFEKTWLIGILKHKIIDYGLLHKGSHYENSTKKRFADPVTPSTAGYQPHPDSRAWC